jgi:2-polyprenyl-3-methyl-5-hydroxy-6-metoxy-1,4-benzoquinol methylase
MPEDMTRRLLGVDSSAPDWYLKWFENEWMNTNYAFYKSFLFNEHVQDYNKNYKILDLGCEWGTCTSKISQMFPNAQVTGIDKAANKISYAQQNNSNVNIRYINDDPLNVFEYPELNNYDFIFCINWIDGIEKGLQLDFILNLLKILKEDNSKLFISATKNLRGQTLAGHWDYDHWRVLEYSLRRWIKYIMYADHAKLNDKDPVQYTTFNPTFDYYMMCFTKEFCNV